MLGVDVLARSGGLDDLRRYHRLLTAVLSGESPPRTVRELAEVLAIKLRAEPYHRAEELVGSLQVAREMVADMELADFCRSLVASRSKRRRTRAD